MIRVLAIIEISSRRAEVATTLPCVRARPVRFGCCWNDSLERLVFAEVGDGYSQRINGYQFVPDLSLEEEDKIGGVQIALQLAMVGRRVIDHIEVHPRAKRRRLHLLEGNFFHLPID